MGFQTLDDGVPDRWWGTLTVPPVVNFQGTLALLCVDLFLTAVHVLHLLYSVKPILKPNFYGSLFFLVLLLSVFNVITGDKFIGEFLKQKLRHYLLSPSNSRNHNLWMRYLEKRLEAMIMNIGMHTDRRKYIFLSCNFQKEMQKEDFFQKFLVHALIKVTNLMTYKMEFWGQFVLHLRVEDKFLALIDFHLLKNSSIKFFQT